jgi:hypothetical protein
MVKCGIKSISELVGSNFCPRVKILEMDGLLPSYIRSLNKDNFNTLNYQ